MFGEQTETPADGVAGGLVAGHDEENEEARDLVVGELLAVELGVDEDGREVVGRRADLRRRQVLHQVGQALSRGQRRREDVGALRSVLRIGDTEDRVRVVEHEVVLRFGYTHEIAHDPQGKSRGDVDDEVALAALTDLVDDRRGLIVDASLEGFDHPGRESGRDEPAQSSVAGIVHGDHRAEELVELRRCVDHDDAPGR